MKKRSSFILLLEHVHTMDELSDEEFGQFVRAYAAYVESGTEPDFPDRSMRMMWKTIKAFDELNCKKYATTSEARQEAGRKGAMMRWNSEQQSMANDSKNSKCHFANGKNSLSESVSESDSISVKEIEDASASHSPAKSSRFHPPDIAEVRAYFAEKGGSDAQAQRFMDFYTSNGWKVGKNPMKSWKAAASGWMSRDKERQQAPAFQRNPVRYVSRPPEEAEKAGDFMKDAPDRTMKWLEKKKKEGTQCPDTK